MSVLAEIEDGIIEIAREALDGKVRQVDPLPGSWSVDTLKRILQTAPAVYVAWLGGRASSNDSMATTEARFGLYVVVNQHRSLARRRGSAQEIGAYEILEVLIPRLHGRSIASRGSLRLQQAEHLVDEAVFSLGATVYSATFAMPGLVWPGLDPDGLADFETYAATHQVGGDDDPDAESRIEDLHEED